MNVRWRSAAMGAALPPCMTAPSTACTGMVETPHAPYVKASDPAHDIYSQHVAGGDEDVGDVKTILVDIGVPALETEREVDVGCALPGWGMAEADKAEIVHFIRGELKSAVTRRDRLLRGSTGVLHEWLAAGFRDRRAADGGIDLVYPHHALRRRKRRQR